MEPFIIGAVVIVLLVGLPIIARVAKRQGVAKAVNAGQETLKRQAPELQDVLGTGLAVPGSPEEARAHVEEFMQLKPRSRRTEADGSWSVKIVAPDDLVLELVTAPEHGSVLWPRSVRVDANGLLSYANTWYIFSEELQRALRKQGVETGRVAGRTFELDMSAAPAMWRAVA